MFNIINFIIFVIGILGGLIILLGVLHGFTMLLKYLFSKHQHEGEPMRLDKIRLDLGRFIILGLEFFIAKDIIGTLITQNWNEIGQLAVLIVIRTILSYFLAKELHQINLNKLEHRKIDAGIK